MNRGFCTKPPDYSSLLCFMAALHTLELHFLLHAYILGRPKRVPILFIQ